MNRSSLVSGSLCSLVAVSCAAGGGGSQSSGYVLLDTEARAAGLTVQVGDRAVTSSLPVEAPAEAKVTLLAAGREQPLSVARGELVYVHGAQAQVDHLQIGRQISTEELHVVSEEKPARQLALQIGGRVVSDETGWRLHASEVFVGASSADVPERLLGVTPVFLTEAAPVPQRPQGPGVPSPGAARVSPSAPVVALATPTPEAPVAVGRVVVPLVPPVSPVAFTPASSCDGVAGVWRGRVYSDPHGAYYDFTLQVAERSDGTLGGTIVSHFWDGTTDQVEPPGTCAGSQHATVVEPASGAVDANGTMRFDATSWKVSAQLCGQGVTNYRLDHVEVPLARGATQASAVVSDDVVWQKGQPVAMTRVSCE